MKKAKIGFLVLLVLGFVGGAYLVGYNSGHRDDDLTHLHLSILKEVSLYQAAESGDLTAVKSHLAFFIYCDYTFYKKHFGQENWSTPKLDIARQIATLAATNGTVVLITNWSQLLPNNTPKPN